MDNSKIVMNNGIIAEKVFKEELDLIESQDIKDFVIKCFEKFTPEYFWESMSSSSGKHHPKISNKKHGLILHIKLAVWWGINFSEMYANVSSKPNNDIIVAALLLHDLQKFGQSLNLYDGKPTIPMCNSIHGVLLATQLEDMISETFKDYADKYRKEQEGEIDISYTDLYNFPPSRKVRHIKIIIACVALHMGRWTNSSISKKWVDEFGEDINVKCVHMADCVASRKVDEELETLEKLDIGSRLLVNEIAKEEEENCSR